MRIAIPKQAESNMDKQKVLCSIVRTLQISDDPESWIDTPCHGLPEAYPVIPRISSTPSNAAAVAGFHCTFNACRGALSGDLDFQAFIEPHDSRDFKSGFDCDNGPILRIGIDDLCSGEEAKIKKAVRFVDTQDCIPDDAFVDEPGISSTCGMDKGHRTWLPTESEQNRMAVGFLSEESLFGIEVGWVVNRFAAALLVALTRAGFVPRDWKWAEQKREEFFNDILFDI